MSVPSKHIYRIAVDFNQPFKYWMDTATNAPFRFPSGVALKIQFAIREKISPETFYDIPAGSTLLLEIKDLKHGRDAPDADDPAYMPNTVTIATLKTLASADWADGSDQHVEFDYDAVDTALPIGECWMVLSGVISGNIVSLGYAKMEVVQDGTGPETTVAPELPAEYSAGEVDALLSEKLAINLLQSYLSKVAFLPIGFDLDGSGSDYLTVPYCGTPVSSIKIAVKSNSDFLVRARPTINAGILTFSTLSIARTGDWEIKSSGILDYSTFPPTSGTISSAIEFGRANEIDQFFQGSFAWIELLDLNGEIIDRFFNSVHGSGSLDGLTITGINGNVATFTGCTVSSAL